MLSRGLAARLWTVFPDPYDGRIVTWLARMAGLPLVAALPLGAARLLPALGVAPGALTAAAGLALLEALPLWHLAGRGLDRVPGLMRSGG
ncbi:protein of unknown function [Candidatus Hydrogenisulfobacillus filiaventi]|uniref:Uncharacterized protein n=1 Tax=Candidatus Hydrogenisulfobacillus filiaventi TaxID=2707344 RepID=A0A6F8ZHG3_9FIRM|nr:protein of unknown function [Candidatus Hydrogenisulfobacillus filiaventi]